MVPKERRVLLDEKTPLDLVHLFDRPEPCSFITPGFRVYTLFWEPAFSNKSRIERQESRPFFFSFSLVELSLGGTCEGTRSRLSDDYYYFSFSLSFSLIHVSKG